MQLGPVDKDRARRILAFLQELPSGAALSWIAL